MNFFLITYLYILTFIYLPFYLPYTAFILRYIAHFLIIFLKSKILTFITYRLSTIFALLNIFILFTIFLFVGSSEFD